MTRLINAFLSKSGVAALLIAIIGTLIFTLLEISYPWLWLPGVITGFVIASLCNSMQVVASPDAAVELSDDEVSTLYVGNLAYRAREDDVRELFSPIGQIRSVRIMFDRATRKPRGYCFVEIEQRAADKAISQLDGAEFIGRTLKVSMANQPKD